MLADAWAVEKSFEECQTAAGSEVLAQLNQTENWWKRTNPTLFLRPGNRVARTDDENGKICPLVSPICQSGLDDGRLEDATVCQYQYLSGKIDLPYDANSGRTQPSSSRKAARIHQRQTHLAEWQREADDSVKLYHLGVTLHHIWLRCAPHRLGRLEAWWG